MLRVFKSYKFIKGILVSLCLLGINFKGTEAEAAAADKIKQEEVLKSIQPNNMNTYRDIGLIDLFINGCYGQNITIAVIEGGFYHTLAPEDRPIVGNIQIPGESNDWHSLHRGQILPPLCMYDAVNTPIDQRFEAGLERGKAFRFEHGDNVLSLIAEAAPQAKILPVQASFGRSDGSLVRALEALSEREDVNIINMSRWLESTHDETQLNPAVLTALRKCTDRGKIIVLSAGNTLTPHQIPHNPTRSPAGVRNVTGDFLANLISDLFAKMAPNDSLRKHIVISGALENDTNWLAKYSVGAGYGAAARNYVATKGTAYSSIATKDWKGTSVSAPYTSAVLANLLSSRPGVQPSKIVEAIFDNAEAIPNQQNLYGRGRLKGQRALQAIR